MRARSVFFAALACAALCGVATPRVARAGNLQPAGINLGFTSFFDGFGRNEEGFTYLLYLNYAMADSINGCNAAVGPNCAPDKPLPFFNDPRINAFVVINQLAYVLPEKLFDDSAHVGIDFILPVIAFDTSFTPPPPSPGVVLTDNGVGLGDLTFGPLLQFRPILSGGRPVFSHRFEFDFIVPTGKYDPDKDINQSSNYVSLNPYWAATVLPFPGLEISMRLHYLYNFKTDRPALGRLYSLSVPPAIKSAQAGQAGWVNFAASYELPFHTHLGVNGYFFKQFNLDLWEMRDGSTNDGRIQFNDFGMATIFGIGPGLLWEASPHDKLFANVYFQTFVENRPQSNVVNLHWIHGF